MYTGGPLDRAGERRRDAAWIAEAMGHPETRFVPVWRDRSLVESATGDAADAPRAGWLTGDAAVTVTAQAGARVFLGVWEERAYIALDLSHHDEEQVKPLVNGAEFADLRQQHD